MAQSTPTRLRANLWGIGLGLGLTAAFLSSPAWTLGQETTNSATNANASAPVDSSTVTPDQLNVDIEARKQKISDLQKQVEQFQKGIEAKQQEELTLQNQVILLESQINQTALQIEGLTFEIEERELEIQKLQNEIDRSQKKIDAERDELGSLLRQIQKSDRRSSLEVLLGHDSFAEFFDQVRYTEQLQSALTEHMTNLVVARDEMAEARSNQETRRDELLALQDRLKATQEAIGQEKEYQSVLLAGTRLNEQKFNDLLNQSVAEQKAAESEVASLQQQLTDTLGQGGDGRPALPKDVKLVWPVQPLRGLSTYFYDPDYIFRKYFEHPGIDIPTPQGTPIAAPADGYVARAKNAGLGYSYIMLIHNDNLATVYGHVSRIDVSEESYVKQGQVIGLTGGLPGTTGSGRLTTGAHLHFEVRLEGIPVNPLDYLP